MHGSVKRAGVEQEEEVLANTPTCVEELSPLGRDRKIGEEVASLATIQADLCR